MTTNDASTPPADDENTGPSKVFIGSAVVIAAIVVLGLVLSLTNILGGQTEPADSTSAPSAGESAPASAGTTSSPSEASVCGLTDVQMDGTVTIAPNATWALVGTTAAPSVKGQGPGKIEEDAYRSCYARTPTGALLAAANYAAIGSHDPLRKKFYEQGFVPGPGRDAILATPPPRSDGTGVRVQIAGFRILRYDGKQADVDLALRTSSGALGATVLNLEWSEGDWKMRLADDGSELSPTVQLPSLDGYTLWSGA